MQAHSLLFQFSFAFFFILLCYIVIFDLKIEYSNLLLALGLSCLHVLSPLSLAIVQYILIVMFFVLFHCFGILKGWTIAE